MGGKSAQKFAGGPLRDDGAAWARRKNTKKKERKGLVWDELSLLWGEGLFFEKRERIGGEGQESRYRGSPTWRRGRYARLNGVIGQTFYCAGFRYRDTG